MKKIKKKDIVLYLVLLTFCIIVCAPLLQMHIASDTYNLMDLGYFQYPSQYFLKDARIISTLFTYLAGILNLDYQVFIVGMEVLAVIIASFSIYILYKTIGEKLSENIYSMNLKNSIILMAITIIIFNCMSLEYFLYAECAVMCLSVLLSIIAAQIFIEEKNKHKYIRTLLILTLATFCYQGSINIFITLVTLLLIIDKSKVNIKENIKQFIIAGIIFVVSEIVNIICMYLINNFMGSEQERVAGNVIIRNILLFNPLMKFIIENVFILNFNLWPSKIIPIFIGVSVILILCSKKKIRGLIEYIFLILVAVLASILPVFLMKSPGIEPRMVMSAGSIIGISIIYLSYIFNDEKSKIMQDIIFVITMIFFIFNTINTIQIFSAHIATNKIDANMGITIKYKIEKYENETGNNVTKVAYHRDSMHRDFPYGYKKKLSSFTQRAFDNYYCIIEALNYYCNRKFEKTTMDEKIYTDNFFGKNWDTYSDEQIVFEGDTMYICTY